MRLMLAAMIVRPAEVRKLIWLPAMFDLPRAGHDTECAQHD
jgi:hypothetical protein